MHSQQYGTSARDELPRSAQPSYAKASTIRDDPTELRCTAFSSNSKGRYADITRTTDQTWQQVYIKNSSSVLREVKMVSLVRQYFPVSTVQEVLAFDEGRRDLLFKRFQGATLNEVRLQYHHRQNPVHGHLKELHYRIDEWFIDLNLRRASDVLAAYPRSFRHDVSPANCSEQSIHTLYHKCLQNQHQFQEFYGTSSPTRLREPSKVKSLWRTP